MAGEGGFHPRSYAKIWKEALETLGTDYIDLWFLHRDDERIPVEHIIDSCDPFVRDGRVKALGAANWAAKRIRKANDYALRAGKAGFVATQLFWNLGSRHYQDLNRLCGRWTVMQSDCTKQPI